MPRKRKAAPLPWWQRWVSFGQATMPVARTVPETPVAPVPPVTPPEVAEHPDGFLFGGVGMLGTRPFEKWRGDKLIVRQGWDVYRDMMLDDAVRAALEMGKAGVLAREWDFQLEQKDDTKAEEIRAVLLASLRNLKGSVRGLVDALMQARVEGFAPIEKLFGTFSFDGRTYWCLREFKLRPAHTFTVDIDRFGNAALVRQQQSSGAWVEIPLERFIWFVNQPEVDVHYGRSDLAGVYHHYWAKQVVYKLWEIFCERAAPGSVVITSGTKGTGTDAIAQLSPTERDNIKSILANWKQHVGLMLPRGYEATVTVPPNQDAFERRIAAADRAIARGLLLPGLSGFAEQGDTGSYSQSQTQLDIWFFALDSWCDAIAETLNEQLFKPLVVWNFGADAPVPRFYFHKLTAAQKQEVAAKWQGLVKDGAVVNTYEDELYTRSLLGYPEREEEAEPVDARTPAQKDIDDAALQPPLGRRPMDDAEGTAANAAQPFDAAKVEAALYGKLGKPLNASCMQRFGKRGS